MEINRLATVNADNQVYPVESKKRSVVNKFISVITTIVMLIFGKNSEDARGNRGLQLTNINLKMYIGKLQNTENTENSYNFVPVLDYINKHLKAENVIPILNKINELLKPTTDTPVYIPIVLKGNSPLESQHIVCIVVDPKTKKIEYFDSQGVTADNKRIEDGLLMMDLLKNIKSMLGISRKGAYAIIQNTKSHQMDCHNCGAFVGYYAQERFKPGNPATAGAIFNSEISMFRDIHPIRNKMRLEQG